jgi:membrane associated rhomboid family serine protease
VRAVRVGTGSPPNMRYSLGMSWSSLSDMRPPMGPVTRLIMLVTVGLYAGQTLLQLAGVDFLTGLFGLSVAGIQKHHWWSLLTYAFLHGSPVHLLVNMLMLYFLGSELERELGRRHFILLFLLSGLLGGLGWLLLTWPYEGVCVGASGALFGLLGGYATLFPSREVTLLLFFIFPITMRAWVLAVVLGTVQFFLMISPGTGGVAYSAHVAGGLAGALYVLALFRRAWAREGWERGRARLNDIAAIRQAEADRQRRGEVDRLLDKVAQQGLHTLSDAERRTLDQASSRLRSR